MKKALLLMALFAGSLLSANAQTADYLTAFVKPGATKQLAIQLKNAPTTNYTAFQMKIQLPDNLSFPEDATVTLNNGRKDKTHQVHFNRVDAQNMNVAVFSYGEEGTEKAGNLAFKNTKTVNSQEISLSELLLVDVKVTGSLHDNNNPLDVSGVKVNEIEFVQANESLTKVVPELTAVGILGDVDGSKFLNTVDATLILMKSGNMTVSGTYNAEAQDVDGDGVLNTVDATEVLLETLR